jgi:lysyl-tRNA synthetase class II
VTVTLTGRLISIRRMGSICFFDLQGAHAGAHATNCASALTGSTSPLPAGDGVIMDPTTNQPICPLVQVQASKDSLTTQPCDFMWCVEKLKRGDMIGLSGTSQCDAVAFAAE